MSRPQWFVDGRPLPVGKRVGRGGEGDVFELSDGSGQAVKVYKSPDREREAKVVAMAAAGLASRTNLIAFPNAVVRDRKGGFVGFTMRLIKGHQPLHELYSPGARKIAFPKADYRFTVRSAANIARAVAQVHAAGVVIGDINHSGILISDQAVAALIDADSFQYDQHLCRVGVPEYTPPELQGQKLAGVSRSPDHDNFGLAVATFQLLFMGRHPFVGRYARGEMSIEKAISEYRFAYSARGDVGMTPPPGACRLTDFPMSIGTAFEAAFGRNPAARPTAVQWVSLLQQFETELKKCSANPLHFFPTAARDCTWCRMENTVGMILYVPVFTFGAPTPLVDPGANGFDLNAVWASIERIQVPDPSNLSPPLPSLQFAPSPVVEAHKKAALMRKAVGFAAIGLAVFLLFAAGNLWLIYAPLAWFGVVRAFSSETADGSLGLQYTKAEEAFQQALTDWRRRTGAVEIHDRRKALRQARDKLSELPRAERAQLDAYEGKRRDAQLQRFLATYPIRRHRIKGIGPARQATLASYGIDTAADIVERAVLRVPGFGAASAYPLLEWRRRLETRFVYSAQPTAADQQATEQIRRSFAADAAKLRQELLRGANELTVGVAMVQQRLRVADPVVNRAFIELEQLKADFGFLDLPLPAPVPARPASSAGISASTSPRPTSSFAAAGPTLCPRCGGTMVRRVARRGRNAGNAFWGCARYPSCKGTRPI